MITFRRTLQDDCGVVFPIYSDAEWIAAWEEDGHGHAQAVARGEQCLVVPATQEQAIAWSRLFNNRFQVPTCVHWDGKTVSMYCGSAGTGWNSLMEAMRQYRTDDPYSPNSHRPSVGARIS